MEKLINDFSSITSQVENWLTLFQANQESIQMEKISNMHQEFLLNNQEEGEINEEQEEGLQVHQLSAKHREKN